MQPGSWRRLQRANPHPHAIPVDPQQRQSPAGAAVKHNPKHNPQIAPCCKTATCVAPPSAAPAHVLLNIVSSYTKRTRVPRVGTAASPATAGPAGASVSPPCAMPRENDWLSWRPPRHTVTSKSFDSAFTTVEEEGRGGDIVGDL